MNKTSHFLWLVCALCMVSALSGNPAQAAITGKVGVGTWGNTQAEFTAVKVVQGATTLYQSDFTAGMTEWTTVNGTWATANGNLQQTGSGSPALALVGSTTWSDYTLTLKARKISGDEGFLIAFGSPGDATTTWWNIGGYANTKHLLQMPGVPTSDYAGTVQTGVWYDIKVELSGPDIRCYLNGTLIHDTARFLDGIDRWDRFSQLINSAGFGLLNSIEQTGLTDLRGRTVYIGSAALATFDAMPMSGLSFASLSATQQAAIIRKVNKNRLTWVQGYGFDGSNGWRDWYITTNADIAVKMFNSFGVFDKHETVNNDPAVATADANYDGWMRFGSQMTVRTFIHEINHTLGGGTHWRWPTLMVNGVWTGQYGNMQLAEFDGSGALIYGDTQHSWPYGLNQDSEYSDENGRRSILKQAAMRRDMLVADQVNYNYASDVANGTYALVPRHAPGKVLAVLGNDPNNSAALGIWTPDGGNGQKFLLEAQTEGTYRISTALTGNRSVELPSGDITNGIQVKLWDQNQYWAQQWFLIPTDSGFYKVAPKNSTYKSMEVYYAGTADGAIVDNWDYTDAFCQQWKIVPAAQVAPTTSVPNGTYTLTPRHAQDKRLEVYGTTGASGDSIDIWTANGGDNQKFLLDVQSDGTYRIRTALTGNRAVEMPGGITTNSTKIKLYDDVGGLAQRWYLIPTDNGWFKIAPQSDITKGMDVTGASTTDGALTQSYDYWGGWGQQWSLNRTDVTLSLGDATVTEGPAQGAPAGTVNATFTVTLSGANTQAITVQYATADGTATKPGDYTATTGTLTIPAGQLTGTISVPVLGDTVSEASETFFVNLSTPTNATIADGQGLGTITNDDAPSFSINDVTVTEGNSSTVNATFTVTRGGDTSGTASVHYATANGTTNPATAGSDYTAVPDTTLTFTAGQTSKTITVLVLGDTATEANETFFVNLSTPVGATLSDGQGLGTITNDDVVLPTLAINDVTITEGNSGTVNVTFTVTRSGDTSGTSSVHYATADGTASAGSDYTAVPDMTLTFTAGQTSKTITVLVLGDAFDEAHETFKVNLSTATGAIIATSLGVGTIHDDDPSPIFSINDVTVAEGNAGTVDAVFNINLAAPSNRTVTLTYKTADGTATAGVDYVAHPSTVLTYTPGQTSKTVTVKVNGDTFDEGIETFKVVLQSATFAAIIDNKGAGTITDDDPLPSLAISDAAAVEGNTGSKNALFTVTLTGATDRTVTVNYATSAVTASADTDYTTKTGTLTFVPGTPTSKTLPIAVLGDTLSEATETFRVNLGVNGASFATLSDSQGVGTITDDDALPALSINDATVTEGNSGTVNATFTVTLAAVSGQTVTVGYAIANGTAVAPGDYTTKTGTLTFAPGETSKPITVAIKGETLLEPNETFTVNLSSPAGATLADGQGTGTITNDDLTSGSLAVPSGTPISRASPAASPPAASPLPASPVRLSKALAKATGMVQLSFDGVLDASVASDPTRYHVQVNGMAVLVESASYSAGSNTVTLGLGEGAIKVGDQVTAAWHDLRDRRNRTLSGQIAVTGKFAW